MQGVQRPLTVDDVLVVTPYNAHFATLLAALPTSARGRRRQVQGQEAPIVIYSMATSTADEAPRGMEFLYSLHRLKVATSRACCVAVIVATPFSSRPTAAPRSRCAWPIPSVASSSLGRPRLTTRVEVDTCPFIRPSPRISQRAFHARTAVTNLSRRRWWLANQPEKTEPEKLVSHQV